jgi:hypothetical protein
MVIIRTDTSPELWQIVLDVLVALGRSALSSSTLPFDPAVRGVGCGTAIAGDGRPHRRP